LSLCCIKSLTLLFELTWAQSALRYLVVYAIVIVIVLIKFNPGAGEVRGMLAAHALVAKTVSMYWKWQTTDLNAL
jgi:hypothetical protein